MEVNDRCLHRQRLSRSSSFLKSFRKQLLVEVEMDCPSPRPASHFFFDILFRAKSIQLFSSQMLTPAKRRLQTDSHIISSPWIPRPFPAAPTFWRLRRAPCT